MKSQYRKCLERKNGKRELHFYRCVNSRLGTCDLDRSAPLDGSRWDARAKKITLLCSAFGMLI
jgi:hypothetical protein